MLTLYDEHWRDDDEKILSNKEFVAKLTNPLINIDCIEGAATFCFDDSGMFLSSYYLCFS